MFYYDTKYRYWINHFKTIMTNRVIWLSSYMIWKGVVIYETLIIWTLYHISTKSNNLKFVSVYVKWYETDILLPHLKVQKIKCKLGTQENYLNPWCGNYQSPTTALLASFYGGSLHQSTSQQMSYQFSYSDT